MMEDARSGWLTPQLATWYLGRRYDPFRYDQGLRQVGNSIRERRAAFTKIVPSIRAHLFKQLDTTKLLNDDYRNFLSVKVGGCFFYFSSCQYNLSMIHFK